MRSDSLTKAHDSFSATGFSLIPALVVLFHRTVNFSGGLPFWDGLRQEQASPRDGARKGYGDNEREASDMDRDVELWVCPQLIPSGVSYG